jgi:photosystem II stability/assembly factor-like uncharacterized protein
VHGRRYLCLLTISLLALTSCAAPSPLRTARATPLVTAGSTPTASPSIPARLGRPAHLYSLHMFGADQGIAVDLQGRLLRTLDGGRHWTLAMPAGVLRVGPFAVMANAPGQTVWTVATVRWSTNGRTPGTALLTTADAGRSFQQRALPRLLAQGAVPPPTFIDAQHGWLLVGLGAAAGSEAVAIYQTVDGGQTWANVATSASPGTATAAAGAIPFSGDKVGLAFRDAMTGWLAGESGDYPWLSRTLDGGRTWQPQPIEAPIGAGGDRQRQPGAIGPPQFFDRQDGVLPAYWGYGVVLVTHDGGASWISTTPLPAAPHPPLWAFLDARHWWASEGAALSITTDGGVHWRQAAPNGALTGLDQLQFVTPDLGWAVLSAAPGRPATVLQTTDGGDTWVDLQPEVGGE